MIDNNFKQKWFDFIGYKPHEGQLQMHNPPNGEYDYKENPDGVRFTVACCGRRWGKSKSASLEAQIVLCQPNKRVWIVAPNYETSDKIFREIWADMVIKQKMPTKRASQNDQYIEFEWGSFVSGKSAEHPNSLIGEGLDLVIIDEAAKINRKVWEAYIRPTLSDKKGRAIFISTPDGFGYFFELYLRGKKEPLWYSFNSPSWENDYAFPEGLGDPDIMEAKSTSDPVVFNQEYGAEFTSLAGRVFDSFDDKQDVGVFPFQPHLPTFCSIDWGFRMPAVLWFQIGQIKGVEHIFIIDEIIHQKNIKSNDLIDMIMSKKYNVRRYYGDPAGYQVQSSIGMGDAELFYQRTGNRMFYLRDKLSRSIVDGIGHLRSFIMSADGTRRLHVDKGCVGIIEDLFSYRYPERKDNTPMKELPLKDGKHDHGIDALRYAIVNRFPIRQHEIRKYKL